MTTLTLFELNSLVRQVVEQTLSHDYWVDAELSECRENKGHCYMELIQKDEHSATPVARASARCWRSQWSMLQPYFERATGQQLHAGMKVRMKVHAQFHEAFGFSWIITDIDPTFTLGDMARRRQEIVRQLREEGVFDLQKELQLPLFCQRIAVVSSQSAAGYGDFANQLDANDKGLHFSCRLFTATMQGEQVETSVIAALDTIYRQADKFDCVVIIRGGGATADLSGFDTLSLAENVAQFPLPIITGIGHDRDESVIDMVSFMRVKTPTAAAQFLIDHLSQVLRRVETAEQRIAAHARQHIDLAQARLQSLSARIPTLFSLVRTRQEARLDRIRQNILATASHNIDKHHTRLDFMRSRLPQFATRILTQENHRMQMLCQRAQSLDPQLILSRGYSLTLFHGHALTSASQVTQGDMLETRLASGCVTSRVDTTRPHPSPNVSPKTQKP